MNRIRKLVLVAAVLALTFGLRPTVGQEEVPKDLGGPNRCLAHVSTDKPIYRGGERVYLRTVLLRADTREPMTTDHWAEVTIQSPTGSTVMQGYCSVTDSCGGAVWQIPEGQPGGEYTAVVKFPSDGYAPAERKFDIRAYRAPRLKWDLEFLKKGYGAGEQVSAALSVTRAEGGAPAGARVEVVARIDGDEVHRDRAVLDGQGRIVVSFPLPAVMREGVGTLALVIRDGGVVETAAKTIPILLSRIPMTAYPEGGDLVAGLPCGLYLEAVTPWGDPADLSAAIVTGDGKAVATIETTHEGRGRTEFTPAAGEAYFVRVDRPAGITELHPLPTPRAAGISLRAGAGTFAPGEPVRVTLAATEAGSYRVALSRREKEIASAAAELVAGKAESIPLSLPPGVDGVLRCTVYGPDDVPLAERLLFVRPTGEIRVELTAEAAPPIPGGRVEVTVRTFEPNGEPISAVVGLTVTDDSVLQMIEKRKQAPRLPVMAFLEPEVRHLEDARIYLSADPVAGAAVDLLLGTQGWRRFAFLHPAQFVAEHGDPAKRVLALRVPAPLPPPPGGPQGGGRGGAPARFGAPNADGLGDDVDGPDDQAREELDAGGGEDAAAPGPVADPAAGQKMKRRIGELPAGRLMKEAEERVAPMVREYAHALLSGRKAGDRRDFAETLYWNAGIRTDQTGTAKVDFHLSDSVTTFRVMADAYDSRGRLGEADLLIESREPFYLEPKLPLEVTAGDRILVPVALVNSTPEDIDARITVEADGALAVAEDFDGLLRLMADGRGRLLVPVTAGRANGKLSITFGGGAGPYTDRVTREISVVPFGFPIHDSAGGLLAPGKPQQLAVSVPADVHPSTITTAVKVYPTPAANLTEALQALVREPYG